MLDPWPKYTRLKSLHSFVPTELLARMAGQEGGGPTDVRFLGVVLFADISGYTPLAEQLCEQGAEGAERLSTILDQAFSHYIGCIHRSGGEVACFAGDALLAYWPVPGDDSTAALRRATDCAAALHGPPLADSSALPQKLELHVGLAVGPLWAARLGGVDGRWQILLAGPAVRDAGRAAAAAYRGATLLSPTTQIVVDVGHQLDLIDSRALVSVWSAADGGDNRPDEAITSLVPRVVQEWVHDDHWHWLPQFRNICALFVRIEGLDENAPDALERHQTAAVVLQTAVSTSSASGGTLMMDDKGLVFQLCLGFPHDSRADDTRRGIRAGLTIERGLKRLGFDCAAGLATGRGLCTALGGPERQHYVAVGRFMHLAARLMEHAGRGLLCTNEAIALVRGHVDWIAEQPLKLKGIADDLRAVRVRALGQPADAEQTLFGRTAEKRLLAKHIAALAHGEGAVVWITGEAGIGKSTLVDHVARLARSRGMTCLVGDSISTDNAVSFLAWRRVFLELLRVDWPAATTPSCPTFAREILADLQEQELAPLIDSVLPGLLEETDLVRGLSGKTRADATLNVLSDVIRRTAGDRFLLVLEDCHWMDSASWRLVERVAHDFPRALLVLTSRPHLGGGELDALRRLERFTELTLAPLDDDAIIGIAGNILAGIDAQAELIDQIVARSSGNPFFAREFSLFLRSHGRIRSSEEGIGRARPLLIDDDDQLAPLTVQGLVASRLDSLAPNESVAVKAASVLGSQFDLSVFAGIVSDELHGVDLDAVLAALDRHHILSGAVGEALKYRFQHDIIRRVAYDQLTSSQRKDLHRDAASVIERVHGAQLAPHFAMLAHHWSMAEVPAATVKYADLAATQALASGAFVEAERLLQTCLGATERGRLVPADTEALVRWHRALADVHQGLGQVEMRGVEARRALALAGRARPPVLAGLVGQGVARTARLCLRRASRSRAIADGSPDRTLILELAKTYRHSAAVSWFSNDSIGMTCDILGAVECAEAAPASGVLASSYAELGGILSVVGLRRVGARLLRRALAVAKIPGDLCELANVHLLTSLHAVGVGDWSTAAHSSELCQELCERMRDQVNWSNAQAIRFWLNYYQARMEPALALANQLQDRAALTGNRQHQAWALRFLAVCDLRQGRPADAASRLNQALERLGETAALNERIPIIGSLALARRRSGQETAADEAGDSAACREGESLFVGPRDWQRFGRMTADARPLEDWFLVEDGGYPTDIEPLLGVLRSPLWLRRNRYLWQNPPDPQQPGSDRTARPAMDVAALGRAGPATQQARAEADPGPAGASRFPLPTAVAAFRGLPRRPVRISADLSTASPAPWGGVLTGGQPLNVALDTLLPPWLRDALARDRTDLAEAVAPLVGPFIESLLDDLAERLNRRFDLKTLLDRFDGSVAGEIGMLTDDTKITLIRGLLRQGIQVLWGSEVALAQRVNDLLLQRLPTTVQGWADLLAPLLGWLLQYRPGNGRTAVLLIMGRDRYRGRLALADPGARLTAQLPSPAADSSRLVHERLLRDIAAAWRGELRTNPAWTFLKRRITVHSQGGCPMSSDGSAEVTRANGEVIGCEGLYVMDAAAFPTSVGVNPSATILAVAEYKVERFIKEELHADPKRAPTDKEVEGWLTKLKPDRAVLDPIPANGRARSAPLRAGPLGLTFEESISGLFSEIEPDSRKQEVDWSTLSDFEPAKIASFETAERRGIAESRETEDCLITMELTASIGDFDRFLRVQRQGLAEKVALEGTVKIRRQKHEVLFAKSYLQFFLCAPAGNGEDRAPERFFRYRVAFACCGRDMVIEAAKVLRDDPRFDVWYDLSTLYFDVFDGDPASDPPRWRGIMRLAPVDFVEKQLRSVAITPDDVDPSRKSWAYLAFVKYFADEVAGVYIQRPNLAKDFLRNVIDVPHGN